MESVMNKFGLMTKRDSEIIQQKVDNLCSILNTLTVTLQDLTQEVGAIRKELNVIKSENVSKIEEAANIVANNTNTVKSELKAALTNLSTNNQAEIKALRKSLVTLGDNQQAALQNQNEQFKQIAETLKDFSSDISNNNEVAKNEMRSTLVNLSNDNRAEVDTLKDSISDLKNEVRGVRLDNDKNLKVEDLNTIEELLRLLAANQIMNLVKIK